MDIDDFLAELDSLNKWANATPYFDGKVSAHAYCHKGFDETPCPPRLGLHVDMTNTATQKRHWKSFYAEAGAAAAVAEAEGFIRDVIALEFGTAAEFGLLPDGRLIPEMGVAAE